MKLFDPLYLKENCNKAGLEFIADKLTTFDFPPVSEQFISNLKQKIPKIVEYEKIQLGRY